MLPLRRAATWLGVVCLLLLAAAAPPEPDSYRTGEYRAPTPLTLKGARVLSTAEARELWRGKAAAFIDVLPQPPRPANLPPGTIWQEKPRYDIPGSLWLPDTGYGELAPVMLDYFKRGLAIATQNNPKATLVFYCQAECWMSWNAAKRALELGYTHVDWYRDGTTGWEKAGLPLERRQPLTRPGQSSDQTAE